MNDLVKWCRAAIQFGEPYTSAIAIAEFIIYFLEDDVQKIRPTLEGTLRRSPFDIEVLAIGGWSYSFLGEPENAIACFQKLAAGCVLPGMNIRNRPTPIPDRTSEVAHQPSSLLGQRGGEVTQ